ncbi:MAG: hypothetical protein M3Q58_11025 [Bacteroidota bacterium]|nr:hypothetical protein [Bacteroidota bacterium]
MSEPRKTFEGKLYYVTLTVVRWIDIFTRKEYVYELMKNLKQSQKIIYIAVQMNLAKSRYLKFSQAGRFNISATGEGTCGCGE